MFDLKGKVALITGGVNGIGAALVREFLKEGVKFIAILDVDERNGNNLEKELATKYGYDRVKFMKCDVTNDEELYSSFDRTLEFNGYIDVVVNNAGIANDEIHMVKKEIAVNFSALVTSSLKGLELMRCDRGGKGGTIINVSSVGALGLLSPSVFVYNASKAAVLQFSSSIGKEAYYTMTKVRTITMCFGATDTNMLIGVKTFDDELTKNMQNLMKYDPMQTAEEAAQGTVTVYKTGKSGSVWLLWCSVEEITDRVEKGYEMMAGNIFD